MVCLISTPPQDELSWGVSALQSSRRAKKGEMKEQATARWRLVCCGFILLAKLAVCDAQNESST